MTITQGVKLVNDSLLIKCQKIEPFDWYENVVSRNLSCLGFSSCGELRTFLQIQIKANLLVSLFENKYLSKIYKSTDNKNNKNSRTQPAKNKAAK